MRYFACWNRPEYDPTKPSTWIWSDTDCNVVSYSIVTSTISISTTHLSDFTNGERDIGDVVPDEPIEYEVED